jgi:hypothetical protein
MTPRSLISAFVSALAFIAFIQVSPLVAQTDEVKFDSAQPKITTVSSMRARRGPQLTAEEIMRLKLGTVISAMARTSNQETIGGKSDYWFKVTLPKGETGWLFGGLLLDYDARRREQALRQIFEARLKAENTDLADEQDFYNLAASSIAEAKSANTRAEFELFKLLALAKWAGRIPQPNNPKDKSLYPEWHRAHDAETIENGFAGGYNLKTELLWKLEAKYHTLPIADRIAWEAAHNMQPSDCESDEVCDFFLMSGDIEYLRLHPGGTHAAEALQELNDALTNDVIDTANGNDRGKDAVIQRTELKRTLASLRLALVKTSAPGKDELLTKLNRAR